MAAPCIPQSRRAAGRHQQHRALRRCGQRTNSPIAGRSNRLVRLAADGRVAVTELLMLLQAAPDAPADEVKQLVDELWSLQYRCPNVMCASAGPVRLQTGAAAAAATPPPPAFTPPLPAFTHAVHWRLTQRTALDAMLQHPLRARLLADGVLRLCTAHAQVAFEGAVPKHLESLFRRGEEFESGVENVLLLRRAAGGASPASGAAASPHAYLERLGALAESSVAGGLQSSFGAVVSAEGGSDAAASLAASCSHVLMTRFASQQHADMFMRTPPYVAAAEGDARLPLHAALSLCVAVEPDEGEEEGGGGGGQ